MNGDEDLIRALANHTAEPDAAAAAFDMLRQGALDQDLAYLYADAFDVGGWLDQETPFAMASRSTRRALTRCLPCLGLYLFLDETQLNYRRPAQGVRAVARSLDWHPDTVTKHAGHLADGGYIEVGRDGQHQQVFRVVHNPARRRFAFLPADGVSGDVGHPRQAEQDAVSGDVGHRSGVLSSLAEVSEASSRENGGGQQRDENEQQNFASAADDDFDAWLPDGAPVVNGDDPVPGWVLERSVDADADPPAKRPRGPQRRKDTTEDMAALDCVNVHPEGIRPCDVTRAVGFKANTILTRLWRQGRIVKLAKGLYGPVSDAAAVTSDGTMNPDDPGNGPF